MMSNSEKILKNVRKQVLIYKVLFGVNLFITILMPFMCSDTLNLNLSARAVQVVLALMLFLTSTTIAIFSILINTNCNKFEKICTGLDEEVKIEDMKEFTNLQRAHNNVSLMMLICYTALVLLYFFN